MLGLLHFLMPDKFDRSQVALANFFDDRRHLADTEIGARGDYLSRLRRIIAPFVLRRLKTEVLDQLVDKTHHVFKLALPDHQRALYDTTLTKWRDTRTNKTGADRESVHIFTQLRKIANHPCLVRNRYADSDLPFLARKLHSLGEFGHSCTVEMVDKELRRLSDFDIHSMCRKYRTLETHCLPPSVVLQSAKLLRLETLLPQLIGDGHRILLFSQWTSLLDVFEEFLDHHAIAFLRIDGQTAVQDRQLIIDSFSASDSVVPVMLLSTRAGGLGINLTAADTVVLHDVDFNPQIDRQAEDRCHRLGQTKPVTVYRLVAQESVDEKIYQLAERKHKLADATLDAGGGTKKSDGALIQSIMTELSSG